MPQRSYYYHAIIILSLNVYHKRLIKAIVLFCFGIEFLAAYVKELAEHIRAGENRLQIILEIKVKVKVHFSYIQ